MLKHIFTIGAALAAVMLPIASSANEGRPSREMAKPNIVLPDYGATGVPSALHARNAPAPNNIGDMAQNAMMPTGDSHATPQNQPPAPMGQAPQQPMPQCPMMPMMQNMMRMGAAQQVPPSGTSAGGGSASGAQSIGSIEARFEGQIAFLRTELHITSAQTPVWDAFVVTLRAGRDHLDAARTALQDSSTAADPMARLELFENHLKSRAEAIHMTRLAFNTLHAQLDESQKRIAITTILPFIGTF